MRSILWLVSCLIVMLAGPLALTANAQGAGSKESSGVITEVASTSGDDSIVEGWNEEQSGVYSRFEHASDCSRCDQGHQGPGP